VTNIPLTHETVTGHGSQSLDSVVTINGDGPVAASIGQNMEENLWGYAKRLRFVREAIQSEFGLRPPTSVRILDVGCGNGSLLAIPLARCGFDVTGIDLHAPSIAHACRIAENIPHARFMEGVVTDLVSPAFDVVILSEVLEHVEDPQALLRASAACLKPGGIVIITVPNGYGEFEIDWWIFRNFHLEAVINFLRRFRRRSSTPKNDTPAELPSTDNSSCGHVQFYRRGRLKKIFRQCSLTVAKESAGPFICGAIVCYTFARSRRFIEWNVRIADKLPLFLVSSWYFVLRRA
jgi:SAM-dependent methyltransferase